MQTQNIQRYIVWAALAAVCYLMLIQWGKDYDSIDVGQQQIRENRTSNIISTQEKAGTEKKTNEDLPENPKENTATGIEKLPEAEEKADIIKVTTDVFDVYVDLNGGDIVRLDLREHKISIESPDTFVTLLQNDFSRTYIAQSGLIGKNGPDANREGRPAYQLNTEMLVLEKGKEELKVPLVYKDPNNITVTKEFVFKKNNYLIEVNHYIENNSKEPWTANLFAQIKRDNSIDPLADTSFFAMKPFLGIAYWSEENKYNKIVITDIKEEPVNLTHKGGWAAFAQHYFISAWIAPKEKNNRFESRKNNKNENIFGFTSEETTIKPGESGVISSALYVGPKDQNELRKISDGLELTVDYGWLWMVAQLLFAVLLYIQGHVSNWGWSIVLLTCCVKLIFFPLNQYAFKSMANMKKLQPKMQQLKEQYEDDRQKLSQATMEMYRKEKINPLGSCLPMLIQMPVFIALYWVLSESVEIRHAEFIFWIKDLSIKDPYFILPGLMAISMLIQQKLSPMVFQDPMQERVMKMMPIMFAFFFLFFPAGLVLYWLVNNILTIAQQWMINRSLEKEK